MKKNRKLVKTKNKTKQKQKKLWYTHTTKHHTISKSFKNTSNNLENTYIII